MPMVTNQDEIFVINVIVQRMLLIDVCFFKWCLEVQLSGPSSVPGLRWMYNFDLGIFLLIVCSNCKLALLFNLTPLSSTISSNFDFVVYNIYCILNH